MDPRDPPRASPRHSKPDAVVVRTEPPRRLQLRTPVLPRGRAAGWDAGFCAADPGNRLGRYNSLHDPALRGFFHAARPVRAHLGHMGFLTPRGVIVPDVEAKQKTVDDALAFVERRHRDKHAELSRALAARLVHNRKEAAETVLRQGWEHSYTRARWRREERQKATVPMSAAAVGAAPAAADRQAQHLSGTLHASRSAVAHAPLRPSTAGSSRPASTRHRM
jgi:hypothetical protein